MVKREECSTHQQARTSHTYTLYVNHGSVQQRRVKARCAYVIPAMQGSSLRFHLRGWRKAGLTCVLCTVAANRWRGTGRSVYGMRHCQKRAVPRPAKHQKAGAGQCLADICGAGEQAGPQVKLPWQSRMHGAESRCFCRSAHHMAAGTAHIMFTIWVARRYRAPPCVPGIWYGKCNKARRL